jgi:hypothetical protein
LQQKINNKNMVVNKKYINNENINVLELANEDTLSNKKLQQKQDIFNKYKISEKVMDYYSEIVKKNPFKIKSISQDLIKEKEPKDQTLMVVNEQEITDKKHSINIQKGNENKKNNEKDNTENEEKEKPQITDNIDISEKPNKPVIANKTQIQEQINIEKEQEETKNKEKEIIEEKNEKVIPDNPFYIKAISFQGTDNMAIIEDKNTGQTYIVKEDSIINKKYQVQEIKKGEVIFLFDDIQLVSEFEN